MKVRISVPLIFIISYGVITILFITYILVLVLAFLIPFINILFFLLFYYNFLSFIKMQQYQNSVMWSSGVYMLLVSIIFLAFRIPNALLPLSETEKLLGLLSLTTLHNWFFNLFFLAIIHRLVSNKINPNQPQDNAKFFSLKRFFFKFGLITTILSVAEMALAENFIFPLILSIYLMILLITASKATVSLQDF